MKGAKKAVKCDSYGTCGKKKDVSFYMLKITQEGHKKLVTEVASREGKDTKGEIFSVKNEA